jgi:hypothetical protein
VVNAFWRLRSGDRPRRGRDVLRDNPSRVRWLRGVLKSPWNSAAVADRFNAVRLGRANKARNSWPEGERGKLG